MKIFVASLPFNIDEADLLSAFSKFGVVSAVKIIINKNSGRSKGFGFIEMPNEDMARKAIEEMNGAQVNGRTVVVSQAEEKDNSEIGLPINIYKNDTCQLRSAVKRPRILR
jgi:RNA recognition motif-containing protein